MNIHTPTGHLLAKPSLIPAVITSSANGKAVDTRGYTSALIVFHLGAHDHTTGNETFTGTVEESADGSTGWAAISGATTGALGAVVPDTTSGNVYCINVNLKAGARLRYLRAVATLAGTTPSDAVGATIYLFNPEQASPTQDATPAVA